MRIEQLNRFEEVVKEHQKQIINFHYRLVGNRFEAEDLAQETFIKAYKKIDSLKEKDKLRGWLFSIARNVTVDFFRKNKEKTVALDSAILENYAEENAIDHRTETASKELSKELKQCLETLEYEDQTLIRLLYYEGFSYKEISIMMQMNENTIKSRLHRARKLLLEAIKLNPSLNDIVIQYA